MPPVSVMPPMVADPSVLTGWSSWNEEKAKYPDGRKSIRFNLKDGEDPSRELIVVLAEESKPGDRRYCYRANPDLGGYSFKNRNSAVEWINTYFLASSNNLMPQPTATPKTTADMSILQAAFEGDDDLMGWATNPADETALAQCMGWSRQLAAPNVVAYDQPADAVPCDDAAPFGEGATERIWTPVCEATRILSHLDGPLTTLRLLEESGIHWAVVQLVGHKVPAVAQAATGLVQNWMLKAQRAKELSESALAEQQAGE